MKINDMSRLQDELKENIILDKIPQNDISIKEIHNSNISDESIRKMLKIILICFCFLIAELIGGIMANSLAILSDAAHLSSDLSGFVISLFSLYIGRKKPNSKYTFGYYRAEVIGALASVVTIWILTVMLVKEAIDRLINPSEINAIVMLITSIFGLICNLAMFKVLHSSHHHHGCSHSGNESMTENKNDNILNIIDDFKDSLEKSKENARIIEDSSFHLEILDQNEEYKNRDNVLLSTDKDEVEYIKHEDNHANNNTDCCRDKHKHKQKHQKHKNKFHRHSHNSHRTYENLQDDSNSHPQKENQENEDCGHNHEGINTNEIYLCLEENVNIKAAIIHILGDIIQSVGVVVAAIVIYFRPDLKIFDPICTFIFSIIVVITTYNITKQCISILMEASPVNIEVDKIKMAISKKV